MAPVDIPDPTTDHHRPFRKLENSFGHWNPRAEARVVGEALIGGDLRGPSPRATVTLIGPGGSQIRGGTLIGTSGKRAPLDPVPRTGSGGTPSRTIPLDDPDLDGGDPARPGSPASGRALDDPDVDHGLLAGLAADRARLAEIARALGACPACWGERIGCPRCGGVGRPGAEDPRPEAFEWYVRPLLDRLEGPAAEVRPIRRPPGSAAHPAGRGSAVEPADAERAHRPGPRITPRRDRTR